ncbi:hypothetical protein, conserved [Babesia bigemina]|uniref:Uncharacterized protein n=1 Tax=Babesia bigemina TaxID=5866 RepID=A0A061BKG3_BABBI|nr:hypothetical protein, conserved [Babesia bigemina]CDR71960.1 hypothetical protein, conserved [Babesia bigemina]|eukprot:XP_012770902.1 hypothetical protein, conserved [Babesia bigemina]
MRHVPKKLTDCPENLRESIDWLIQVRYGNGDSDGLDELAKALKKLIEEAIEKATKSLQAEKDKLECPVKYTGHPSNCAYIDTLIEKAGKSKNPNGLNKEQLVKNKQHCQNNHEYYRSDAQKKALQDIKERETQLKDLTNKLSIFTDKNHQKCTDLLTNLCTGLETFLGFNSETKGYTGHGIVYSDLDRLCDGVMGFFHGVLESVEKDPSVTTYYTGMNDTLKTIKESMHNPGGLSAAVTAVSEPLGECDREVTEKTQRT